MGAAESALPRVLLDSPIQMHLLRQTSSDAAELLKRWSEDGMPLALLREPFIELWCLADHEQAQQFFATFDTDDNRKIDALEAYTAAAFLCQETIDNKVTMIFSIFDFAKVGSLSFDEANILAHSIGRGLSKVCQYSAPDDADVLAACRSMFDLHNLPYDSRITEEQLRRWVVVDADAVAYVNTYHKAISVPDFQAAVAARAEAQAGILADLRRSVNGGAVADSDLLASKELRQALGAAGSGLREHSFKAVVSAIVRLGGKAITDESFAEGLRAWNIFDLCCSSQREIIVKELIVMLRLWNMTAYSFSRTLPKEALALKSNDDLRDWQMQQKDPAILQAFANLGNFIGQSGTENINAEAWLNCVIPPAN